MLLRRGYDWRGLDLRGFRSARFCAIRGLDRRGCWRGLDRRGFEPCPVLNGAVLFPRFRWSRFCSNAFDSKPCWRTSVYVFNGAMYNAVVLKYPYM